MEILRKIAAVLKNATYNNPKDERLFVYRNKNHKWMGITINLGHPKACSFWMSNVGLLLLFVSLMIVFGSDVSYGFMLTSVFLMLISWEAVQALEIAEFGDLNDRKKDGCIVSNDEKDMCHDRSYVFLFVNLVILASPLSFAIAVRMQSLCCWGFMSCLAVLTLGRMIMLVCSFLGTTKEVMK